MCKKLIKNWNVNVDNIIISKLVETKNNSKYLIEYLDEVIRPLVVILPEMSVNTFKDKDGDNKSNNKLMTLCTDDDKLLENIKPFGLRLKT